MYRGIMQVSDWLGLKEKKQQNSTPMAYISEQHPSDLHLTE